MSSLWWWYSVKKAVDFHPHLIISFYGDSTNHNKINVKKVKMSKKKNQNQKHWPWMELQDLFSMKLVRVKKKPVYPGNPPYLLIELEKFKSNILLQWIKTYAILKCHSFPLYFKLLSSAAYQCYNWEVSHQWALLSHQRVIVGFDNHSSLVGITGSLQTRFNCPRYLILPIMQGIKWSTTNPQVFISLMCLLTLSRVKEKNGYVLCSCSDIYLADENIL